MVVRAGLVDVAIVTAVDSMVTVVLADESAGRHDASKCVRNGFEVNIEPVFEHGNQLG